MTSSLLLGLCVCGEPLFRHRVGARQIACADIRRIDQQLLQSGAQAPVQPVHEFQIIAGGRDRDRAIAETDIHAGER